MDSKVNEDFQKLHFLQGAEKIQVLVVEDDDSFRELVLGFLKKPDRDISAEKNGKEAIRALQSHPFDLVISDLVMPGADGMEVLREAKKRNPDCVVILITGYASLDSALQAIRGGAYDYLRKPFKLDQLEIVVNNACEKIALIRENQRLLQKLKESMEEMKELRKPCLPRRTAVETTPSTALDHKISEMEVLLKQMIPLDSDPQSQEQKEKAFRDLQKLVEYKREGLLNEAEFSAMKKMLLQTLQD
jgi:DNA-binding NtrC family response regulator